MRPLGNKSYSNFPSRTRSGKEYIRARQLSGVAKEKDDADLMFQDRTFTDDSVMYVHEGWTHAETLECGTQVLNDFTDGFDSGLDDAFCDTQVLDSEDTFQAHRGSLEGEQRVSNVYKNRNYTGLEDMEDMRQNRLPNLGAHLEENKNGYCKENLSTSMVDDHCKMLCTESLVTTSDRWITVSNGRSGNCSSSEMNFWKSSSDCLTDGILDHSTGTSVSHNANNNDATSVFRCLQPLGRVPFCCSAMEYFVALYHLLKSGLRKYA